MKSIHLLTLLAVTFILPSCGNYVASPGDISLEKAMASVGRGLVAMRQAQGHLRTGLIVSDAQVTFNISATGSQDGKLYVEASPIPTTPVIQGKVGGEANTSYGATRGNQITINFKNVMLADPTKTLIKNPAAITELARVIRKEADLDMSTDYDGPLNLQASRSSRESHTPPASHGHPDPSGSLVNPGALFGVKHPLLYRFFKGKSATTPAAPSPAAPPKPKTNTQGPGPIFQPQ